MRIVTPQQMKEIDEATIGRIGIPGIVLMENAALVVVSEIHSTLGRIQDKRIILFAGKGNNGGDAFAVARHLFNKGASIKVYTLQSKANKGDGAINAGILKKMGVEVVALSQEEEIKALSTELADADLVVDGLLGTGLQGEVTGTQYEIIQAINQSQCKVLAIDIPSGICGYTGRVLGTAVKADVTVTLALPKPGLVIHPGCEYAGRLVVADISIPAGILEQKEFNMHLIDDAMVSEMLPRRKMDSNKGSYGRVWVISGSVGMTGSGCLAARAALRSGAGLVYLGVPAMLASVYDAMLVEAIVIPLEDQGMGILSASGLDLILERLDKMTVLALGPGLSQNKEIVEITTRIIQEAEIPLVLDADALNAVALDVSVLKECKSACVVTPHPGEMARLTGISVDEVQNNRIDTARNFAITWGVVTVLKGARTLVAMPDGRVYINPTGNAGMATGGTGDVLTGVIASLIGQGATPEEAAIAGVYLHGLAGDSLADMLGEHGMIAGDLTDELPHMIKRLNKY